MLALAADTVKDGERSVHLRKWSNGATCHVMSWQILQQVFKASAHQLDGSGGTPCLRRLCLGLVFRFNHDRSNA